MHVAIICEDFAGMRAQALGLAERAGLKAQIYPIRLKGLWRSLPLRFCPFPLAAIEPITLPGNTSILLSVGGTGGAVGVALRKKTNLPLVQIQNPRMNARHFDLIIANRHDRVRARNLVEVRTALHGVTPEKLTAAAQTWRPQLCRPHKELLSVLLGGSNGRFRLGLPEAHTLAEDLRRALKRSSLQIAVTPSRRTCSDVVAYLRKALPPERCWIWDGCGENPYLGLLGCADAIAVTSDSVSMISEAVATTAPVFIIQLPGRSRRISSFIDELEVQARVRDFSWDFALWPVAALDDTGFAAEKMLQRLATPAYRRS